LLIPKTKTRISKKANIIAKIKETKNQNKIYIYLSFIDDFKGISIDIIRPKKIRRTCPDS